jgi:MFS family permease
MSNQTMQHIKQAVKKPHVAWGMWMLLLSLAILTITTYATGALCNDYKWLCFGIALLILIAAIILMVLYTPSFVRNRACLQYLKSDRFKMVNKDLFKVLLSSNNTLFFYFLLMGTSVTIVSAVVVGMSATGAGCLAENQQCNMQSLQLSSTYTGAMVTSIVLAIVFGIIVIGKTHNFAELFTDGDIKKEVSLINANVTSSDAIQKSKLLTIATNAESVNILESAN